MKEVQLSCWMDHAFCLLECSWMSENAMICGVVFYILQSITDMQRVLMEEDFVCQNESCKPYIMMQY